MVMASQSGRMSSTRIIKVITSTATLRRPPVWRSIQSIKGQVGRTNVVAHRSAGRKGCMIQKLVTRSPPMNSTVRVIRPIS